MSLYIEKSKEVIDVYLEYVSIEDLLENSDIISLHIPYTKETHHFLNEKEFERIRKEYEKRDPSLRGDGACFHRFGDLIFFVRIGK